MFKGYFLGSKAVLDNFSLIYPRDGVADWAFFFKVLLQFNVFKVYKMHNNFDLDDAFIAPHLITSIKAHSLKYL